MSEITKANTAETLEFSDLYVEFEPCQRIDIQLETVVLGQFGDAIQTVVRKLLDNCHISEEPIHVVPARKYAEYANQRQLSGR